MSVIVSDHLADQIHFLSLTRTFCYLRNRNYSHWVSYLICEYFECRLMRLFCQKITERNGQRYLFVLNVNNYDVYEDLEILERMAIGFN